MDHVKNIVSSLKFEEPITCGDLSVLPFTSEHVSTLDYILLEDGLQKELVNIREVSESGSVPELVVENHADLPVLIVDGEELVGAKQNRIANLTMLIPANQNTTIPVSCVESGRWSYRRRTDFDVTDRHSHTTDSESSSHHKTDFDVTDYIAHVRSRAENLADVRESIRHRRNRRSNQGRVWSTLEEESRNLNASSPTGAMDAMFDRHRETLDDYVKSVKAGSAQVGAIFVVKNRRYGLDLFDQPKTFARLLPKLVRSYAIDVLGGKSQNQDKTINLDAQTFLDRILNSAFDDHQAVGLGSDVGVVGENLVGGGLVVDDTVVHLTAFASPPSKHSKRDPKDNYSNSLEV